MWLASLTAKRLFFTGKGGVGKTSLACAAALASARSGQRTLIVSTDPASNLDEVLGLALGAAPQPVPAEPMLWAANLDPEAAAAAYREKVVAPYRGKLPAAVIRNMEEQFSGACTTEIAAFDEFVRLMADPTVAEQFDRIVFDTAPTGHTLRLLSLPSAWSGYLNTTTAEASCLGPLAGLQDQRKQYQAALAALANPAETTVVLVARPEAASLREADRTRQELADLQILNLSLVVNAVYQAPDGADPASRAYSDWVQAGLDSMPEGLAGIPVHHSPLLPKNIVGLDAVAALADAAMGVPASRSVPPAASHQDPAQPMGSSLQEFVDGLEANGKGVVMTMGKGGVGKTTSAVLIATELARRGRSVLLTSTDPAGNLSDLGAGSLDGLRVERIDPKAEVARYTQAALAKAAGSMDADGLALLEEDLRSPCTEEIAVFRAFAEAVDAGEHGFVVIDTAPTGHTILLLDATEAYHREVARTQSDAPEAVRKLLPRLRDPGFTSIVLVTLPEPTPVHEAIRLSEDLARAGISPYGWIVNRTLAGAGLQDPVLAGKAAQESGPTAEVLAQGLPTVVLPWRPTGAMTARPLASAASV